MKERDRFFITGLVAVLVTFSAVLAIPQQITQALTGINQTASDIPNATVTKEKLNPNAVKIVVFSRTKQLDAAPDSVPAGDVQCKPPQMICTFWLPLFSV